VLHLVRCDGVTVRGVRMHTHGKEGNDGIDIESKNVVISDCHIQSDDDAICFKSPDKDYVVENCAVTNCIIASNCNAIKFGTASLGGFRNIAVSNCVIRRATETSIWHWKEMYPYSVTEDFTNLAGLALEVVDGGFMDQVVISNIAMTGVQTPIFIRLGARKKPAGTLKNIIISGITATSESLMASTIAGIPGHCIENVILRDILIHSPGGGTAEWAEKTPDENEDKYPENRMFGKISPAHGLYARHVRNLTIDNIQCYAAKTEERPAFRFDDVKNYSLENYQATTPAGKQPLIKLIQSEPREKAGK
jgi:polygalacturonase